MSPEAIADVLDAVAAEAPDRIAVSGPSYHLPFVELSYSTLVARARNLGRQFLALGLRRGDRVATWLTDSVEYVEAYVACAFAGLVVVPVNERFTEHEARHILADSGAKLLLCDAATRDRALIFDQCVRVLSVALFDEVVAAADETVALGDRSPDEPFVLGYTSGTTGPPKGAILTQGSVAAIARMNAESYHLPEASVAIMTGSMSFVAVVPAHVMTTFFVGGTVRLLGPWNVPSMIDAVERWQGNFVYVPSPLIEEFATAFEATPCGRWSSLTTVLHSASKVSADRLERLASVVGGRLVEGWGLTENSGGLVTATTPDDARPGSGRLATCGRAAPGVRVRLLDDAGMEAPHDGKTVGELAFHSPALLTAYWNRDEPARDQEGWFRSGDLGTIDADGYVSLVERRVDLIVSGGMNVYPFEVEQVLVDHPDVLQACVVGVEHERWGQSVAAAVVRRTGSTVGTEELLEHCRTRLASYKKPTRIEFFESLPTTTSHKVARHAVRVLMS